MKKKLIRILEEFGYPVFLQGTLNSEEDYPAAFFTFWNFSTPENKKYDNKANGAKWGFWIEFYSNNPIKVEKIPLEAKKKLEKAGFEFDGKPCDITSVAKTYTGARLTAYILENYGGMENEE